jgi:pantetheine-phosphate adenylyltransferase
LSIAVYPGTFDPIHYGHIDIARRAALIFDKVVVGIYDRPQKNLLFSIEDRLAMVRSALEDISNIQVDRYNILTVDFARQHGARVIVRGLRVISDFELEYQMALMNRRLARDIDVVCLMTSAEHAFVSSSIIKEIAVAGGDISQFVPAPVAKLLQARLAAKA